MFVTYNVWYIERKGVFLQSIILIYYILLRYLFYYFFLYSYGTKSKTIENT